MSGPCYAASPSRSCHTESCLHPDEPPAFITLSGESIKTRSGFHAAIFLLDLCTIKSLNPLDRDSLSLCPFQYSADTKRFIVYNCICYLSKHSAPLSRKHIGGEKPLIACCSAPGIVTALIMFIHINKHTRYLYLFNVFCVRIPHGEVRLY